MSMMFSKQSMMVPDKLSAEEMRALSELAPWRFCLALGFDLAVIAAAVALSEWFFFSPLAYLVSILLIGSRLHALGVLMHDCVHYRAFRDRKVNMMVGELIAWSVLTTAEGYRNHHLLHHRHLNTPEDPDWVRKSGQDKFHFPKDKATVAKELLFQLSGLGIVELSLMLRKGAEGKPVPAKIRALRLSFYLAVFALCITTGTLDKLALYWLAPLLTSFPLVFYVRSVAEHHGNLSYDHLYTSSRTTIVKPWEGILLLPHNVGYHLEHHLYPQVPFYRLPALHRRCTDC